MPVEVGQVRVVTDHRDGEMPYRVCAIYTYNGRPWCVLQNVRSGNKTDTRIEAVESWPLVPPPEKP
jgi:hypothetical protein